jgi:hypothetical protein
MQGKVPVAEIKVDEFPAAFVRSPRKSTRQAARQEACHNGECAEFCDWV